MFNVKKLDEKIYYYTSIYDDPNDFLQNILKSNIPWREWVSSGGEAVYGELTGGINFLPADILATIKNSVMECLADYCKKTKSDIGFVPDYYTIQKYIPGTYMGPHVDSIDKTVDKFPTVSIVVYLNDNYEGGNIVFPNQNLDIKPEAGSMIIFPSYEPYVHDPKPVISGYKYMSPVFCFKEPF